MIRKTEKLGIAALIGVHLAFLICNLNASDSRVTTRPSAGSVAATQPVEQNILLIKAVRKGWLRSAQQALSEGADVNTRDKYGTTPLCMAAKFGDSRMAKLLIEHGANPDIAEVCGRTPLMIVKTREIAEMLISAKAAIDVKDNVGTTALMQKICDEKIDIVQLLIKNGANVNIPDAKATTPLMAAKQRKLADMIKLLLENGARIGMEPGPCSKKTQSIRS